MISLIAERPILLFIVMLAFSAAFAFTWVQTGKRTFLVVAAVILAMIPVGLYVSEVWVTHKESLTLVIKRLAKSLEEEQYDAIYSQIAPEATQAIGLAKRELPNYEFQSARVTAFREFEIRDDLIPPEAIVEFVANVAVSHRHGQFGQAKIVRVVIVKFRKTKDSWQIVDYTHHKFPSGPDSFSPNGGERPVF